MAARTLLDRYYEALARAVQGSAWAASVPLYSLAYAVPVAQLRPPRLDIYVDNPALGWRLKPDARAVHALFESPALYTVDASGCRVGPGGAGGRPLHMLGCSWTFGYGVGDEECFPSIVGRETHVVNHACPGWGTQQQYALMKARLLGDRSGPRAIVYFWMPWHLERVWRARRWLQYMSGGSASPGRRKNPLYEPERGRLVFRGLIGVEDAVDDPELVAQMEWRITHDLVVAMDRDAREAGVPFIVALLPMFRAAEQFWESWEATTARFEALLEKRGIRCVNLATSTDEGVDPSRFLFQFHPHPTPYGHAVIARRIIDGLLPALERT